MLVRATQSRLSERGKWCRAPVVRLHAPRDGARHGDAGGGTGETKGHAETPSMWFARIWRRTEGAAFLALPRVAALASIRQVSAT